LRVRAGRAVLLRQRATAVEPGDGGREGWDVVRLQVTDATALAHEVAGYGPDVVALEPPDLRAAVVRVLSETLRASTSRPRTRKAPRRPAGAAT
jgi:proteasome accessory factor B